MTVYDRLLINCAYGILKAEVEELKNQADAYGGYGSAASGTEGVSPTNSAMGTKLKRFKVKALEEKLKEVLGS